MLAADLLAAVNEGANAFGPDESAATHLEGGEPTVVDQLVNLGAAKAKRLAGVIDRNSNGLHSHLQPHIRTSAPEFVEAREQLGVAN